MADSQRKTYNLYNTAETDWTLGILDDNGQPTGSTSSHYTTNFTQVLPQTIYYLSGTIITTGTFRIYFYDGEKKLDKQNGTEIQRRIYNTIKLLLYPYTGYS